MKHVTLASIVCSMALILGGCQRSETAAIKGTYTTTLSHATIPASPEMIGTWEITFDGEGKYFLRREQLLILQGEYSVAADTLRLMKEVGMGACTSTDPGVYIVSRTEAGLKLQLVGEPCQGRALVLAMFPLARKKS
jgi:hypothetical protein